jgi:hypothetical protein
MSSARPRLAALAALAALPALVASVVLAPPASAAPVAVSCGDIVTGEAYLAADLTCAGDGLTLVGDVTLDLAGHTLAGDGTGTALRLALDATQSVRGGRIEGWGTTASVVLPADETGLYGEYSFSDLVLTGNGTVLDTSVDALLSGHAASFRYSGATFTDNGVVFTGVWGGGVEVASSWFAGNGTVADLDSWGLVIDGSHLEGNDVVLGHAVEAIAWIRGSVLVDNRVVSQGGDRFSSVILLNSDISGSDTVLAPSDVDVRIAGNLVRDNDVALAVGGGSGDVYDNTFRGNRLALSADPGPDEVWIPSLVVTGNTFRGNVDAVVTQGPRTELGSNTVHQNSGRGIYAPGATDLGGNRAWGNGVSPQCTGVVCKYRPRS